ncbi:MAG: AcrR family transcriptional regulator [Myxococcota bacterium]|jgi:AcrR family transcriptional regulator
MWQTRRCLCVAGVEVVVVKKNESPKGEQKRAEIGIAAYQCFRELGYTATTVDSICKKAGISKGSFYWHFPSKQDVFVSLIEMWTRQIMDELYEQFEDAVLRDDYGTAVTEALQRETHRGRVVVPLWLEFTVLGRHEPEIQQALAKFYRRARSACAEILRPQMEPECTDAEIQSAAAVVFGAYAGLIIQEMSDPGRLDAGQEIAKFMTAFKKVVGQRSPAT